MEVLTHLFQPISYVHEYKILEDRKSKIFIATYNGFAKEMSAVFGINESIIRV